MPYSYNIDMKTGCVFVKAWGKISEKELIDHLNQLYSESIMPDPAKKLLDLRDVTDYDIHYDNAEKFHALLCRYNKKLKNAVTAVVAPSDSTFGVARMLGAYICNIVNSQTFRDINKALEFLNISYSDYKKNTVMFSEHYNNK